MSGGPRAPQTLDESRRVRHRAGPRHRPDVFSSRRSAPGLGLSSGVLRRFRNVLRPAAFHGHGRSAPFFEGWYFKFSNADASRRFAVIPGVYDARDPAQSHCFIQLFDGSRRRAHYLRYPRDAFWAHPSRFEVRVGASSFSRGGIVLDIESSDARWSGAVSFEGVVPWPVTLATPGVMGPFAWLPFLECYHGVIGLDHTVRGQLDVGGESIDMSGGRGYTEKDWGRSFPASWIWAQCNHFERPGTSLTASIAMIPNLGRVFPGYLVGLWHDGQLHQFTTYRRGAVESLEVDDAAVHWCLRNARHRLSMTFHRAPTTMLPGPTIEGMQREVHETLDARVEFSLHRRSDGRLVASGRGEHGGLEIQGEIDDLRAVVRA